MSGVDTFIVYKIISALSTPFDETEAFKMELIDKDGKKLRSAKTQKERAALTMFDRLIFNLKRTLSKVGLTSRIATMAAALFLIREHANILDYDDQTILEGVDEQISFLQENHMQTFNKFNEEMANSTGAAVVGTGSDEVHWADPQKNRKRGAPKKVGRFINGVAYLKRTAREADKKRGK